MSDMDEPFTPDEAAEFLALVEVKQRALVQAITLHLNRTPENEEETIALIELIGPDLVHPLTGMGPGAMNRAFLDIVTHLVGRLAGARGETVSDAWRREAAELAREADGG